jgi:hypothetical protein
MRVLLTPISSKAKSRVGKRPVVADVEQDVGNKLFVVISPTQCRWVTKINDTDFIVEELIDD